jgi:hypothetical protein
LDDRRSVGMKKILTLTVMVSVPWSSVSYWCQVKIIAKVALKE